MKNYSMSKKIIGLRSILFFCLTTLMIFSFTGCPVAADEEPVLESIYIKTYPDKMEYQLNEPLDLTGIEVMARYSNGSEKAVYDWSSNPEQEYVLNSTGEVSIVITCQGFSTSFTVTVEKKPVQKTLSSIYISKQADKLSYDYNSLLELTGLEIKGKYSDGTEEVLEGWTSEPKAGTNLTASRTVTITYEGKTTTFTITVAARPVITSNEYFWGTWVRMDNGKEYEVLETSVVQGSNNYKITASDSTTLTVNSLGKFTKESDGVIVCNNIPYYRKGGANLEYSLKLVGFTTNGRAAGIAMSGIKGKGKSLKYSNFESNSESDTEGNIKFTAPTAYDTQTVEISNGNDLVVIPGLKINNSGDYMGTVALVGKDDYNLKITGTISDDQKDNGYLYGNNAKTYNMKLTITNVSENKCSASKCIIESTDAKLLLNSSDEDLSGISISTLAGGATKEVNLSLIYGELTKPYVDTGITVTIQNPFTKQEWKDYIPLRFFKGTIPITIAAKNPENNANAALNGFVIYPDGNNQFFAIKNNDAKPIFVPTFGTEKPYMLVFSGATVTSQLGESTEMFYTVEPISTKLRNVITKGSEIDKYMIFGGNNHSETTAYPVTEGFEAYLLEGEIDYYTIKADSNDFYGPGGTTFYSVSYVNEKGDAPDTFLTTEGEALSIIQLPEMTCNGYKFLGWYSGTTKVTPGSYKVQDNITLTAKWQLESYPVVYEINGGTNHAANPSAYTIESSAITLQAPVRTGYDFGGWFVNEDFSENTIGSVGGGSTGEIKLYAKWTPVTYKITYELNEGTNAASNPSTYTIETDTITLAAPQKEGFAFGGWFTESDYSGTKQTTIEKGSHVDKKYYAKWLKKCTVSYVTTHSTAPTAIIVGEGEKLTAEQLPELTTSDYFFGGWYVGETRVEAYSYVVTDDVTLTAKWSDKCTVSYVTVHGTAPEAFTVESGTTLTAANLPSLKEKGWRFLGWYTSSSYEESKKAGAGQSIITSMTLYAKWEEFTGPDDGFVFVEGGTVVGSDSYNQNKSQGSNYIGAFPAGRTVTLNSFYISDHEVTQGEYEQYCCYTSSAPSSSYGVGADYPVYYVSWYDAIVYCNLKSMAEGLTPCYSLSGEIDPKKWTGIKSSNGKYSCSYTSSNSTWNSITRDMNANGYRLPTEAEWEYAARGGQETYGTEAFANYFAGTTTTNYSAQSNSNLDSVGWYWYNICNNGVTGSAASSGKTGYGTHEIKTKAPNALGLYDMSGNVWEWCWDWYNSSIDSGSISDPLGPVSGSLRLSRSGSWDYDARFSSVSRRDGFNPYEHIYRDGFRLARTDTSSFYKITYQTAHGTTPEQKEVRSAITDSLLPEINESGWVFDGWYLDSACTQKAEAGYALNSSITLYAKWREYFGWEPVSNGTYKFEQNGITWFSNNKYENSSSAETTWEVTLTKPIRYTIGYKVSSDYYDKLWLTLDDTTFVTALTGSNGTIENSYTTYLGRGKHTLNAIYSKNSSGYSGSDQAIITLPIVDYDTQGVYDITYSTSYGTKPSTLIVEKGKKLTAADLPQLSATGCSFQGWYDGENKIEDGYEITGNLVLTAKWNFEEYKINYNTNGGKKNTSNPSVYTIDEEVILLPASYANNQYTFAGWFLDSDFTTKITKIERGTTGEITLYARWGEPATVTVTLQEYNDIEMTFVKEGNYITFTGTAGFSNYEWQVDGSKLKSTSNTMTVDVSSWSSGRHVIILTAKNKDSGKTRTATAYIIK